MAPIITVSLYAIRIASKHKTREKTEHALNRFDGRRDFLDLLVSAFSELHSSTSGLDEGNRRLTVPGPLTVDQENRIIHGIVEVGGYGYGSSLRDIRSGEESYKRKPTDAEMVPLYIRIWTPLDQPYAIMALQNFGEVGCKTLLTTHLQSCWTAFAKNYSIRFREIVPPDALEKLLEGNQITKLRFVHHGVPQDIADSYGGNALDPRMGEVELVVSALRRSNLGATDFLKKIFRQPAFKQSDVVEFAGIEPQEVKVELMNNRGRKQTITFADVIHAHSRVDVSDRVSTTPDGHPTFETIAKECSRLIMMAAEHIN